MTTHEDLEDWICRLEELEIDEVCEVARELLAQIERSLSSR